MDEALEVLKALAGQAADRLERLANYLRQVEEGTTTVLPERVADLPEWLAGLGENARRVRELIGPDLSPVTQATPPQYLPFNRKERYYTGTVLPMVIASSGFAHLHHFLDLCGLPGVLPSEINERAEQIQFLTEFGFAESAWKDEKWRHLASGRDTPDIVIVGPDWILTIEAKLYANQHLALVQEQMKRQEEMVNLWAKTLGVPPTRVRLVALFPAKFGGDLDSFNYPVVAWEAVRDAYRGIAPLYWFQILDEAIHRFVHLRAIAGEKLTGDQIVGRHQARTLDYVSIGRKDGPAGPLFRADLETGSWHGRAYEVSHDAIEGSKNWWPISEFLLAVLPDDGTELKP